MPPGCQQTRRRTRNQASNRLTSVVPGFMYSSESTRWRSISVLSATGTPLEATTGLRFHSSRAGPTGQAPGGREAVGGPVALTSGYRSGRIETRAGASQADTAHRPSAMSDDRLLAELKKAIAGLSDEAALAGAACRVAVEQGGYRMAWVGMVDPDTQSIRPLAHWGHEDGYLSVVRITTDRTKHSIGPTGTAIKEGRPVINRDFRTTTTSLPWRLEAMRRGYLSSAAFPLFAAEKAVGTLNLYAGEPDYFTPERVEKLREFAAELSRALAAVRR